MLIANANCFAQKVQFSVNRLNDENNSKVA